MYVCIWLCARMLGSMGKLTFPNRPTLAKQLLGKSFKTLPRVEICASFQCTRTTDPIFLLHTNFVFIYLSLQKLELFSI